MEKHQDDHVGRRFYSAVQRREMGDAADYLTSMTLVHLQGSGTGDATLQVFLSAHLVSAFDLSGILEIPQMDEIEQIIARNIKQWRENSADPLSRTAVSGMVHSIMLEIGHTCGIGTAYAPGRMDRIRTFIEENYGDPNLNVGEIARRFGLSEAYLSRTFRQNTGGGLSDYLHRVRISHARKLLSTSDLPVGEVGIRVGFGSPGAFIRAFSRVEGITPGNYRAQGKQMKLK